MIRVEEQGKRRLALPVPIILAWLLLWPWGWGKSIFMVYVHIFVLLGSLSGIKIDVTSRGQDKLTRISLQ